MEKITPFLWFDGQAEAAARHYVAIFKNSKITSVTGSSVTFELEGRPFVAFNGGPHFKFTEAISLFVDCETQEEVDALWERLVADGGAPSRCGWLKDKFGLSWQIIPSALGRMLQDPDPQKAKRAMEAMLIMAKIDIAAMKRAYNGA